MKTEKYKGFTLAELITTIVIITLLLGILVPVLSEVKKIAGQTKQKAQIAGIEMGIILYKNDFGEYPPSHGYCANPPACTIANDYSYSGAQTLAEAMFGQDLLGFNPDSIYRFDGWNDTNDCYRPNPTAADLGKRKEAYLDRTNIGVFEPNKIFKPASLTAGMMKPDGYVICDIFTRSKNTAGKTYKIGTPVLYFRANPSASNMQLISDTVLANHTSNIYNFRDNYNPIRVGNIDFIANNDARKHKLIETTPDGSSFYNFIRDPMIPISTPPANSRGRPVRPDSFLLISAGFDGMYGTKDDICNFNPNLP